MSSQFLKFCVVGGSGYVINLVAYSALLHAAGFPYLAAAVGAFTLAATNNYTWNRLWTFRDERGSIALQGTQFLVVAGAALGANLLLLRTLVGLGIEAVPAQAMAIVLVTPLNYLGNKIWTFRAAPLPTHARFVHATITARAPEPRRGIQLPLVPRAVGVLGAWLAPARSLVWGAGVLRFFGFAFVAFNAVVLNTATFAACAVWLELPYPVAGFIGAQLSTLWSFVFLEAWVFHNRAYARGGAARLAWFLVATNAAVALSAPFLLVLSRLGLSYLATNLIAVAGLTLARFALADRWIWRSARRDALDDADADSPATTLLRRARSVRTAAADRRPELEPAPLGSETGR